MTLRPTRGERSCNPGNIREAADGGIAWRGERATNDDPDFEEFDTPEEGIRALARVLLVYQRKHGLRTLRQVISRWAPPNENDTDSYVRSAAIRSGLNADSDLDLENLETLCSVVRAIIHHENGRVIYPDWQIERGVQEALA